MEGLTRAFNLPHYYSVLAGKKLPSYLQAKNTFLKSNQIKELLQEFVSLTEEVEFQKELVSLSFKDRKEANLLEVKSEIVKAMLKKCILCERRCRVNRFQQKGICKVPLKPKISSIFLHYGEEEELIPSLTVFYSGCNFHCVYCQNFDIARFPEEGEYIHPVKLAYVVSEYEARGALNVNFVGGDPTPAAHHILEVLSYSEFRVPVIWNSNMFMSKELMQALEGVVDLYLADFKYGNDDCAFRLSGIRNYIEVVERNLTNAFQSADVIIRHLVIPSHIECCTEPVLRKIRELNPTANVNVMFQYHPCAEAYSYSEISRRLTREERNKVINLLKEIDLPFARAG